MLKYLPPEPSLDSRPIGRLTAEVVTGVGATDPEFWARALPNEVEGHAYQAACERTGRHSFALSAAVVRDEARVLAVVPLFTVDYRLDTSLQGGIKRLSEAFNKVVPGVAHLRLLGFGSPYADTCAIAIEPTLDAEGRIAALSALVDGVIDHADEKKIALIAVKDLPETRLPEFVEVLRQRRFARINGLPNCALDLDCQDVDGYLAKLSRATRKDIRRKLKSAAPVRIERRTDIRDISGEIRALYEMTRAGSSFDYGDFETLPDGYFERVSESLGDRALFLTYWVEDQLAAFNLLLLSPERDRAVDKFLGMRKDLAEDLNLYAVSWIENVKFCLERDIHRVLMGPTAYNLKLRFGCHLEESGIWFRHKGPVVNAVLRSVAPFAAFDRFEPELVEWRKRAEREAAEKQRKPVS